MNQRDEEKLQELLRAALPKLDAGEPARDLWPAMQRRLDRKPSAPPWFDWALAGGLVALACCFPAAIPVLLYYL
jgi:hypothetical protein